MEATTIPGSTGTYETVPCDKPIVTQRKAKIWEVACYESGTVLVKSNVPDVWFSYYGPSIDDEDERQALRVNRAQELAAYLTCGAFRPAWLDDPVEERNPCWVNYTDGSSICAIVHQNNTDEYDVAGHLLRQRAMLLLGLPGYEARAEHRTIQALWDILDSIDSTGDLVKSDDAAYRARVERLQAKRWELGITTNGYTLDITGIK